MSKLWTVIRPLGEVFNGLDGISDFTFLGNGYVVLILDVQDLVRRIAGSKSRRNSCPANLVLAE